jgi:hypothetical protein
MSLSAGRPERAPPTEADRFAGTPAVATRTPAVHRHHQRIRRSPKRPTGPTSNMPGDDRAPVQANGHDEPVEAWSEPLITVRAAAGACGVTPTAVRGWLADGRIGDPPWTVEQLESVRDRPSSRARGAKAAHGTVVRYAEGCSCDRCRTAENDWARDRERAKAGTRLPESTRQQLLAQLLAGHVSCCLEGFRHNRQPCLGQGAPRPRLGGRLRCGPAGNPSRRTGAWHQCRVRPGLCTPRLSCASTASNG